MTEARWLEETGPRIELHLAQPGEELGLHAFVGGKWVPVTVGRTGEFRTRPRKTVIRDLKEPVR